MLQRENAAGNLVALIDKAGVIVYKSAPGPFGFKPADLGAALERIAGSS